LREGGIEIVSPTFMNTPALSADQVFVPESDPIAVTSIDEDNNVPEEIKAVYDELQSGKRSRTEARNGAALVGCRISGFP